MNCVAAKSVNTNDPWKTWPVSVKHLRTEAPGVFTIDVEFASAQVGQQFQYAPGQFNMLYVPGVGEAAISIAGSDTNHRLQHTIRSVGSVTQSIAAGGVGMSMGLRGPFGSSWPIATETPGVPHRPRDVIIVAGGIGLAPLRSLVRHITQNRAAYSAVHLLIGARAPCDLLYQDQVADWRASNIDVQTTVDRAQAGWNGHIGVVTLLVERLVIAQPSSTLVMTCGPEVMMRYVAKAARQRGIPAGNIWVTLERNMNCAIGLCGHCQLGPEFVCKDGPVFRYDQVEPWLRVQEL